MKQFKLSNFYNKTRTEFLEVLKSIKLKQVLILLLGSAILAFGLYNIHYPSRITEGGILGLTLFLEYWFNISPAFSGFVLNLIFYIFAIKILGKEFLVFSAISAIGFSVFYFIFEQFSVIYPQIAESPFLAAILGALFVGVGVGLCELIGGAPGGDDALVMGLQKLTNIKIQW